MSLLTRSRSKFVPAETGASPCNGKHITCTGQERCLDTVTRVEDFPQALQSPRNAADDALVNQLRHGGGGYHYNVEPEVIEQRVSHNRLLRSREKWAAAERQARARQQLAAATVCPACSGPDRITVRAVSGRVRNSLDVVYEPTDGQHIELPPVVGPDGTETPRGSVVACSDCRPVLTVRLAERLAAQQLGTRTRGAAVDAYLSEHLR